MRGYPDFFGQPIFEKKGPVRRIEYSTVMISPFTEYELFNDSNKGELLALDCYFTGGLNLDSVLLTVEVDNTLLINAISSMPPDLDAISGCLPTFDIAQYNRRENILDMRLQNLVSYLSSIKITASQYSVDTVIVFIVGMYRHII